MSKKNHKHKQPSKEKTELHQNLEKRGWEVRDANDLPDEAKISAKFLEIMDPFVEDYDMSVLSDCMTIAWNEALAEDHEIKCRANLNNPLLNFNNYRDIIDELKLRKKIMYPGDLRSVMKTILTPEPGGRTKLNVASTMTEEAFMKRISMLLEEAKAEGFDDEDFDDEDFGEDDFSEDVFGSEDVT